MIDLEKKVFNALALFIGDKGTKTLLPSTLIKRIALETGLVRTDVQRGLLILSRNNQITGIDRSGMPYQKVGWVSPDIQPVPEYKAIWWSVLDEHKSKLFPGELERLNKCYSVMKGLKIEEISQIFSALVQLRSDAKVPISEDRYIYSAQNILGSSKAIDNLKRITDVLNLSLSADKPIYYVLTAGKITSEKVIFIENPRVFNYLANLPYNSETLLISCYGYGLTLANFGSNLINNQIVACPTDGEKQVDLLTLLDGAECYYWGDLDYEGVFIYDQLKKHLPNLYLSAIYKNMIEDLDNGIGHSYHPLFEKESQSPKKCLSEECNLLMDICKRYEISVDQEAYCQKKFIKAIFSRLDFKELSNICEHILKVSKD